MPDECLAKKHWAAPPTPLAARFVLRDQGTAPDHTAVLSPERAGWAYDE